ncbi:uncharacterized protein LOC114470848 isoform X3 [Gouania willdenowi]|uniref:uncharacterized protein LOC114470848 isoform X3 n=1 Tax=Gouania willdenowi TaxID=441366 RepID=UPI0010548337|nr:uncharacterized protein LOC114470848 isoform X3 [Gouania willdenowi]
MNTLEKRADFTTQNGIYRINQLKSSDSGQYRLEYFVDGGKKEERKLNLSVQAPVSSVQLVPTCLSMGEKKVSCSSKGDSLLYSWTLDGRPLTDSDLVPKGSNTNIIHLKLQTVGKLVCHVQNKVSKSSGEVTLTTCGVENHCDGRQNNAQCYAALDGSIFIRLMDSAVENHSYMWSKDTSRLLRVNDKHVINTLEKRADFTTQNGIYRINQLKSSDSGQYRLDVFVDGVKEEERKLNLSVQAPVSSVQLVPTCLSMGEKKVSCSSKGDSLLYSWTLDGRPLTDSDLVPKGNNTKKVHLKLQTVGKLVCHVQNKVSKSSGEVTLTTCGYIFINCTLSNGTDILQWVLEATNTLCVDPTTAPMGVENHCDGRQNNAQCYAALDGSIFIRLMDSAVENHAYMWYKDTSRLLVVNNKRVITNALEKRADFTTQNGIYRINQLKSSDSGQYQLEVFVDGGRKEERKLNLSFQAPVSSVQLVPTCLSMGEKKVSCSSKGDSLLYSWTLDGRPLTDSDLVPKGSNTNIIHLKLQTVGKLVCHVQNKVSKSSGEVTLTTCGVENHCDGRQNNAQCYAALDGSIFIRLMDSAVENHTFKWSKDTSQLLVVNNKHVITNTLEKRADFTTQNGIYRINQLKSSDSGQYRLDVFVDGGKKEERKLNLSFQAPVSSVQLVPTCLSMGEKKVSCSSKGDSLLYSWTLDGRPLTDSDLVPKGSNTNIIHLKLQTVGKLVCHVQNKVSKSSGEVTLTTCGYIFINCTLSNGTDILQWVLEATNTLCVDPTTAPMGVENHCDGRQNNTQCYAALDGSIFIRLMDSAVENHIYNWFKDTSKLLVVNNKHVITNTLEKRAAFTTQNSTYRINQLNSSDSGQYRLEVFAQGVKKEERILNLSFQAPVSSVQLVPTCLSMGEKKVSCSSKGDSLLYSWTLDGRPLTDSDLVPKGNNTNNVHLKLQTIGKLVCHVQNKVSKSSGEVTLTTCGYIFINCTLSNGTDILQWVVEDTNTLCVDPTTAPMGTVALIGISLSALVCILLLALVVICVQKKKPNKPKEPQDDQELTYAAVKVVQRPGTLEVHRSEVEVEYGEVKFSQQPRQIQVPPDDCVYARVYK